MPGQKLDDSKAASVYQVYQALERCSEKIIPENLKRKALEIAVVTAHRESDFRPEASNRNSSAVGMFQQTLNFHQRNKFDPWDVKKTPLSEEQRKDVGIASSTFFKQLASTPGWERMTIRDAAYEVQKCRQEDKHRFHDPEINKAANCLGGALYPGQQSQIDNPSYSTEERAHRRWDCSGSSHRENGTSTIYGSSSTPSESPTPSASSNDEATDLPLPTDSAYTPSSSKVNPESFAEQHPLSHMPEYARQEWRDAVQDPDSGQEPISALVGIGGGAALGAATGGGVTLVPASGGGIAISLNLVSLFSLFGR